MKKGDRFASLIINPLRTQKVKTPVMCGLALAVAILSSAPLIMDIAAQGVKPPVARFPKEKEQERLPDLVSYPYPFTEADCFYVWLVSNDPSSDEWTDFDLRVRVTNEGKERAPESKVTAWFKVYRIDAPPIFKSYTKTLPAVVPGGHSHDQTVRFRVPRACFNYVDHYDYCTFSFTVDSTNQVRELNEYNNTVNAKCQHP